MADFKSIELKWQKKWFEEEKAFEPSTDSKKKFLFTVPYPYVSGPLHVGHGRTYVNGDVMMRFKRMQGYNVLWPIGFHITGTPVLAVSMKIQRGDEQTIKLLPDRLQDLIGRSRELQLKVLRLDATIHAPSTPTKPPSGSPVERQLGLLKAAFEQDV